MAMSNKGLTKLLEECAELSVEAAKLIAFPDGNHPDGKGHLIERLENEMADVLAAIRFVQNQLHLDQLRMTARYHRKLEKFYGWNREADDVQVQTGGVVGPTTEAKT